MTNKISSAYQQFSQQVRRQSETTASRKIASKNSVQPAETARHNSPTDKTQLSRAQKAQLKQLRETGTLENLRSILSEDEETLLGKLFPEQHGGYTQRGNLSQKHSAIGNIKGGFFDQRL